MFVAVLRRSSVSIYRKESLTPVVVNFPSNLVANLEVKDANGLAEFLAGLLKSSGIPTGNGVLLLSAEVCFVKDFASSGDEQTAEAIRSFLGLVPIGKSHFVSKEFVIDNKRWVCVSNRAYCVSVVYGLQAAGLKVVVVLPAFVAGVTEGMILGAETLVQIEAGLKADKSYSMLPNIFAGEKKPWWRFW